MYRQPQGLKLELLQRRIKQAPKERIILQCLTHGRRPAAAKPEATPTGVDTRRAAICPKHFPFPQIPIAQDLENAHPHEHLGSKRASFMYKNPITKKKRKG